MVSGIQKLAIGILPVDDEGNTWLVGQYRYTLDEYKTGNANGRSTSQ